MHTRLYRIHITRVLCIIILDKTRIWLLSSVLYSIAIPLVFVCLLRSSELLFMRRAASFVITSYNTMRCAGMIIAHYLMDCA
jgi:hypothetical protein